MIRYFIPYFCAAAIQLIACAFNMQKLRHVTKALLMPCLSLPLLLNYRTAFIFVLAALLFGWAGDLFLMFPNNVKWRTTGSSLFAVGHLFYFWALLRGFSATPRTAYCILVPLLFLAVAFVIFSRLHPLIDESFRLSAGAYFVLLAILNTLSLLLLLSGADSAVFSVIGGLMFFASDTILVYQFYTVGDPAPKLDFFVMLTYIMAQAFLVTGFVIG